MSRRSMARNMPPSVAGRSCEKQDCKQRSASGVMLLIVIATGEAERAQGIGRLYGKVALALRLGRRDNDVWGLATGGEARAGGLRP
jgi:hypothetical protein